VAQIVMAPRLQKLQPGFFIALQASVRYNHLVWGFGGVIKSGFM